MLRDPSLIPLSRHHQHGLALCVMMRRSLAADSSPDNIAAWAQKAIDNYEVELVNHFEIEEQVLFPACGAMPIIPELVADHRAIEAFIARLRTEQFCALLTSHIRREENELFEQVQRVLPRAELDRAGAEIDRRAVRVCL
jgi:hemerythrin-like domain-containing protein